MNESLEPTPESPSTEKQPAKPSGGGCSLRTLIISMMLVSLAMGLFAVVCSKFTDAQVRALISRSKADLRSLATGLESYFADHGSYPPCGAEDPSPRFHIDGTPIATGAITVNTGVVGSPPMRITFRHGTDSHQLTTPTAYLTSYYIRDSYFHVRDVISGYYTHADGWIAWGVGPGYSSHNPEDRGMIDGMAENFYAPGASYPSVPLINCAYDSSNGTYSNGDIFRVQDERFGRNVRGANRP